MRTYIDIHTHQAGKDAKSLVSYSIGIDEAPPSGVKFSAGIHPWSAGSVDLQKSLEYLQKANIAAIGEIGLDYAGDTDRQQQTEVFEKQLEIARERELPVIIHCVKAYNEVLSILKMYNLRAVIFHGYTGSPEQTKTLIDRGYYLSFGEVSLNSPKTMDSLKETPLDCIFAETDTKNISIECIYARIAVRKRVTVQQLQEAIENNYKRIFG